MTKTSRFVRLGLSLCIFFFGLLPAFGSDVVISQVYGGGGNSGATLKNDYIELFNRGSVAVSLNGWSVQYASSAGTTWQRTNLSNILLQPGQYYLVQESLGAGGTVNLPTPDASGTIAMSATAGKVALVRSQTTLTGATPDFVANNIADFVGFGGANYFEGSGPTPGLSNTTAALRLANGCTDTDSNASDFVAGTPNPHNTASALSSCNATTNPSGTGSASPASPAAGTSVLLTMVVTPGSNPTSTGITVVADLSGITGGAAQPQAMFDDGSNGDVSAGDGTYSFLYAIPGGVTEGSKSVLVLIHDAQGRTGNASITLSIAPPPPPTVAIHDIQGPGTTSPMVGQSVSTSGIVTARKSNGFFLQTPDGAVDADPNTSEGVFVFTSSAPPASAQVGNEVQVIAKVQEFIPSADVNSPPVTELGNVSSVQLLSTGNPLPAAITLTAADTSATGSVEQLERFEGMRVHVNSLTVSGPTDGTVNESSATSVSTGIFYGVITGITRPFREPGIETPDPLPAGAPATVTMFDANPERLRVDTKGQTGSTVLNLSAGAVVTNITGPLDYGFRAYTILQDPTPTPGVTPGIAVTPVPEPSADELTVASFNMERFFDTDNDPHTSDAVLTATAFANRLNKASLVIRHVMKTPDIVGVEEMENITTLQAVADKVNADALAETGINPDYQAFLEEGVDIGGIDVGFLVKSKINVLSVHQEDVGEFTQPDGTTALLNDRPSLTMHIKVSRAKADDLALTVIVNHLRSLSSVDDPADGSRVRAKRKAQADFLANLLQEYQNAGEKIISVGDYNAFGFNDGYVDSMGIIEGHPVPATETTLAGQDLVDPDFQDLADLLPLDQRYSFNFDGNAQELDHVIVNQAAVPLISRFAIARVNSDFPESLRGDANRPERISDHDPAVAYFQLPAQDFVAPALTLPANITAEATGPNGAAVNFAASALDAVTGPAVVVCTSNSGDIFSLGTTTINCSATDGHDNTATGSFTITVVDTTAPNIVITSPAGNYTVGQTVNAAYSCSDLVGVATCTGDVSNGSAVDTASVGTHTFTVNSSDAAGNLSSAVAHYDVNFSVCVLFDQAKANKSGSTVPIKVALCDGSGHNYSSAGITLTATGLTQVSSAASFDVQDAGNANPDGNFRYDGGVYIFNLKTTGLAAGTYALSFKAQGDPGTHAVTFQVR